jgi:drug/metabolite transporter (DMT)-like permease
MNDNERDTMEVFKNKLKLRMILEDEQEKLNIESEKKTALIYYFLSSFLFTISFISIKFFNNIRNEGYNISLFASIRFLTISFLAHIYLKKYQIDIHSLQNETELNSKDSHWLFLRLICTLFAINFFIISSVYIRLGSIFCIYATFPFFTSIFCMITLKEGLNCHYILGIFLICVGSFFLTFNEQKNIFHKANSKDDIFEEPRDPRIIFGIICSIFNAILTAIIHLSTKILSTKFPDFYIDYFVGKYCSIFAFSVAVINYHSFINSIFDGYLYLFGIFNGLVSFYGFYFLHISLKMLTLQRISIVGYIQLVIVYSVSHFYFEENFYFLDFLGMIILVGYGIKNNFKLTQY